MLVDEGRVSPEEASSHPQRSLLTRALDGRDIDPEYSVRQVLRGDRYLICSDGLSGVVSAETIGQTMQEIVDPQACVERLVQLALRGGGPDNITVVIADATDADIVEQSPIVGGAASLDRGNTTVADSSTPAARASALQSPRPAQQPETARYDGDPEPSGHPVRTALLVVALLAVLGGGLWLGYRYTQSQFYVGATEEGQLAVFRGVPGQIAGLDLSSVDETNPTTRLDDLTTVAQERVKQGIHADNRPDAVRQLSDLTADSPSNPNLKPLCTGTGPTTADTAPPSPGQSTAPGSPSSAATIASTPSAQVTESSPPVVDPVGCRTVN
jgi:protein phosphatase